jgi:phasin family protein
MAAAATTPPKPAVQPAPVVKAAKPPVRKPVSPTPSTKHKENIMTNAFETTQETVKNTVNQLNSSAEAAMESSKAAMEQVAAKSREAVEASMKTIDEMTDMARGNVEAMLASARAASTGIEAVAAHISEVSRKSFEEASSVAKSFAAAKSPNELMQLQSDFAKTQFDTVVAEMSKMTEMMMKISGDVFEPMQNRIAIATDKMKTIVSTK